MRLVSLGLSLLLLFASTGAVWGAQGAVAQSGTPGPDLRGSTPLPLTGARRAAFEAYVADALRRYRVPGASLAVVENGQVVYLNGFGVTTFGGAKPVTPDTMMMIGSITKSLTTALAATLVDDGSLTWDTPLVDLQPDFAVGDPALTCRLSIRDAFCNCVGIPGRNLEWYFRGPTLTPQEVLTALAETAPNAPRGARYQYNNLLIAAGGYALGAADTGSAYEVGLAYDTALRQRVLGPIGMARTTFSPEEAMAGGDYALPHAVDLRGTTRSLPVVAERSVLPVRPSGGLWSNAREMARFLQTELADGVAPDGTRVVSAENLAETWRPEVAIPAFPGFAPTVGASQTGYGLGWMSGDYRGQRVINHAGGTNGFSAELAFLPDAGVGIVVLTNSLEPAMVVGASFLYAVQFRLFELLFDQPPAVDAELSTVLANLAAARPQLASQGVDRAAITPYLGRYGNPQLGAATLSLRGDRLLLDTGALVTELWPRATDAGAYLMLDPPLSFFSELAGATVTVTGASASPRMTLTIPANPTADAQEYLFEGDNR